MVGGLQLFQYELALGRFLLVFAEMLGVSQFGNGQDVERHIVTDALCIVADARHEVLARRLTDLYQYGLHVPRRRWHKCCVRGVRGRAFRFCQ